MKNQRGFSLVEMIVAMTVTLIVSSAIYGLLTSGGNAFRREPELADRQQNIRVAMDLIVRDVYGAGAALPTFAQVFAVTDPAAPGCTAGLNGCGQAGTMGAAAAAARGGDVEATDVLQIVSTDEQCPQLALCSTDPGPPADASPGAAGIFVTQERLPQCLNVPGLVVLAAENSFTVAAATATGGAQQCFTAGGAPNANLTLTATLAPWAPGVAFAAPNREPGSAGAVYLYRARVVRYRIAPNPDPVDPTPSLWRSESGLYMPSGADADEPSAAGFNPGLAGQPWQLVARGIEDLQVEYLDGFGAWLNQPPLSTLNTWESIVRQVRITLSARANAPNLQGMSQVAGVAVDAVRGQLSTVVTPRSAFQEMQMCLAAALPLTACAAASHVQ